MMVGRLFNGNGALSFEFNRSVVDRLIDACYTVASVRPFVIFILTYILISLLLAFFAQNAPCYTEASFICEIVRFVDCWVG